MSLYDDFDKHRTSEKVAGWSSGIKLLQSQLQLKKAATTQVSLSNSHFFKYKFNIWVGEVEFLINLYLSYEFTAKT